MPHTITAKLGFSRRDDEPATPDEVAVPGYPDNRVIPIPTEIRDARDFQPSLEREGFTLARHVSAFAGDRDKAVLTAGYYGEVRDFLKAHLGAAYVRPSGASALLVRYGSHFVGRRAPDGPADVIDDRIPASFLHIDYYPEMARAAATMETEEEAPDTSRFSRMMLIQTWRAVSGGAQDVPLAVCDRRTLDAADISPRTGILSPQNAGEDNPRFTIGGIHRGAGQDWYYFPRLQPDELLLMTAYDSAHDDAWKVGHGAFDNRHTHPDAQPRISFEARFFAWFE